MNSALTPHQTSAVCDFLALYPRDIVAVHDGGDRLLVSTTFGGAQHEVPKSVIR